MIHFHDLAIAPFWDTMRSRDWCGELARRANTPVWLNRKGEVEWNLSGSLNDSGHHEEALVAADKGIAALQRVLGYGPDSNAEKQLLILYNQKANVLGSLHRYRDAVEPAALSHALRTRRLIAEPGDPARERDLVVSYAPYALVLAQAGRRAEACAVLRKAGRMWDDIRRAGHLSGLDARRSLDEYHQIGMRYCRS